MRHLKINPQNALYAGLFLILFTSAAFLISFAMNVNDEGWAIYGKIYVSILLAYTWYLFILLFLEDRANPTYPAYDNERVAVLVPCYNEEPELLRRSVESVVACRGNTDIIIIDDGSKESTRKEIGILAEEYGVKAHYFEKNQGKREALYWAVTNFEEEYDFVVTIDSDTVLDSEAIVRVVEPLKDPKIGASTGDVRLLNEKENWLTGMIGTYYWIGLNIYKKAQSSLGMVVCCSGCLAAYKASVLKEIIHEFKNQTFLGENCTHSEDRHLTNLTLKRRLNVVYTDKAVSFTETPATVRGFLKQQQRWKRGFIRESIYTLTYAWKTRPFLFFQILLWDLTAPFLTFGMRIALVFLVIANPLFFLTTIIPVWILFMFVRYIFVVIHARDKIPGLFSYMIFYEVFLYWMNIYALFTVRNKSWITR